MSKCLRKHVYVSLFMRHSVEAIGALKPLPRMGLPPGGHNGVSVYAMFPGRTEFWLIQIPESTATEI